MSKREQGVKDPDLELKVLKCILIREGLISSLKELITNKRCTTSSRKGTKESILKILTECRDVTVKLVGCVMHWRAAGRVEFIWCSQNYLLKICNDMDFLSDCSHLVSSLQVPKEKMIKNPLMLPNTLNEARGPEVYSKEGKYLSILNNEEENLRGNKRRERENIRCVEALLVIEDRYIRLKKPVHFEITEKIFSMLMAKDAPTLNAEKRGENESNDISNIKTLKKVMIAQLEDSKKNKTKSSDFTTKKLIPDEIICVKNIPRKKGNTSTHSAPGDRCSIKSSTRNKALLKQESIEKNYNQSFVYPKTKGRKSVSKEIPTLISSEERKTLICKKYIISNRNLIISCMNEHDHLLFKGYDPLTSEEYRLILKSPHTKIGKMKVKEWLNKVALRSLAIDNNCLIFQDDFYCNEEKEINNKECKKSDALTKKNDQNGKCYSVSYADVLNDQISLEIYHTSQVTEEMKNERSKGNESEEYEIRSFTESSTGHEPEDSQNKNVNENEILSNDFLGKTIEIEQYKIRSFAENSSGNKSEDSQNKKVTENENEILSNEGNESEEYEICSFNENSSVTESENSKKEKVTENANEVLSNDFAVDFEKKDFNSIISAKSLLHQKSESLSEKDLLSLPKPVSHDDVGEDSQYDIENNKFKSLNISSDRIEQESRGSYNTDEFDIYSE